MAIIQGNAKKSTAAGGFYPKTINGSLRFNDDDSAYLSWTPTGTTGGRTKFTYSGWVKISALSTANGFHLLNAPYASNQNGSLLMIDSNNEFYAQFRVYTTGSQGAFDAECYSNMKFRDPSAWYHIVFTYDSTAAETSRMKLWVNGVSQSFRSVDWPGSSTAQYIGSEFAHQIGRWLGSSHGNTDGYMAEVHFTDGTAYTADAFGELKNGVWVAKTPDVTYGTNGFHLNFQDDTEVEAFNTVLYRGNGGTQSITGMGFQPDLVWIKCRSTSYHSMLTDSVRGAGTRLSSSQTAGESADANAVDSFDSDGFTVDSGSSINENNDTYVAWGWKAGDSNVSNNVGSIPSTVRANQTYGFSIVSYTGSGSAESVGHGLNDTPAFIITKNRTDGGENSVWLVWHQDRPNGYQYLNTTSAGGDTGGFHDTNLITSSTFGYNSTGANSTVTNETGDAYIAYCWAEKTGYSKFGSFSGSGATDQTITTNFKPAFILIKRTNAGYDWVIIDNTRDTVAPHTAGLFPNLSFVEYSGSEFGITFNSDGFTLNGDSPSINASGGTYIYAAFADTREAAFWLDQSGNDNDWQPVNLDHNDTVADSPTDNFATWNPLARNNTTYSDGNLNAVTTSNASPYNIVSTIRLPTTGKWYAEVTAIVGSNNPAIGIGSNTPSDQWALYRRNGTYITGNISGISSSGTPATYVTDDVIGVAYDADAGSLSFYKNGVAQSGGFTSIPSGDYFFVIRADSASGDGGTANFGQQPFKYDPPA